MYSNEKMYTIKYHSDAHTAPISTIVRYGVLTKTKKISELGFSKADFTFMGWKAYREIDDKWYIKDTAGRKYYKKLADGRLPEGYSYVLYRNGESVKASAPGGVVHFYAQWAQSRYVIKYHRNDKSSPASATTTVLYGKFTKIRSVSELGFHEADKTFKGWKAYREIDCKWFVKNPAGYNLFMKLVNGQLPPGYSFVHYKDGECVKATAPGGVVHFYAQWK